jgi:hypothetical protein
MSQADRLIPTSTLALLRYQELLHGLEELVDQRRDPKRIHKLALRRLIEAAKAPLALPPIKSAKRRRSSAPRSPIRPAQPTQQPTAPSVTAAAPPPPVPTPVAPVKPLAAVPDWKPHPMLALDSLLRQQARKRQS